MASVKDLELKRIDSKYANRFICRYHYSGRVVTNSQLHFGVFHDGRCRGVMSFGPSMDKRNIMGLVRGTGWNEFLELNRMAFMEVLPKNSESRCLAIVLRLIKKANPAIRWVISYADGIQSGTGCIYRATGFLLTGIKKNADMIKLPSGKITHLLSLKSTPHKPREELGGRSYFDVCNGKYSITGYLRASGGEVMDGNQYRYIYFYDQADVSNLVPAIIPYSEIKQHAACQAGDGNDQLHSGGATPTGTLQA